MKVFAMLMLRCALVMLLSSLFQNGTLAQNEEYLKLHLQLLKWEGSCRPFVVAFSDWQNKITLDDPNDIHQINQAFLQILSLFINSFDGMLDKLKEFPLKDEMEVPEVNECPIEGMEERLKRRLQKPLKIAKLNCKKLEDKINHSGLEENKNYLASLSSKIRSIAKGIEKEFITFISEVELELIIKKFKWPSDSRLVVKLRLIFDRLLELTEKNFSYCNTSSFLNGQMWTGQIEKNPLENQKEFDDQLETIILNAKLGILENELSAKIVAFEEQEPQDVDGFMEFSEYFKLEWNKIEQKTEQLKRNNAEKKEDYSKRLDDLAEIAMKKTAPLKAIITKKLDQLCPGSLKNLLKKVKKSFKSDQKEEAKKEIDALKQIISDIGMFDGAAYKLLVSFGQKLDNTAFSFAKLKEAVEQDKKMVLAAYQVKDKITSTMK